MKKILLRTLMIIGIAVVVLAAGLFAIYRWLRTHPNVPSFYVESLAEFEDATKKDGFIVPDLGRYEGIGNFDYRLYKKNGMWAGKKALYGEHTGYEIFCDIEPRTNLRSLKVSGYERMDNDGVRFGDDCSVTRYRGVDVKMSYWDAEVRNYGLFRESYPVGTVYRSIITEFEWAGYRYGVWGYIVFEDGEPGDEDVEATTAAAIEEMMVIIRGIIGVGVGG